MRYTKPRIEPVADDKDLTPDQAEILAPMGARVLNIFRTLVNAPKAASGFLAWANYVLSRRNDLPAREREIVILRIGYLCKSGYEWTQHVAIGRREGLTDDEIAQSSWRRRGGLERGRHGADQGQRRAAQRPVHHRHHLGRS